MRKKSIIALLLVAAIPARLGVLVARELFAREPPHSASSRGNGGDIASTVSATGALSAVKTVSVGTQVSGQVAELLVDFNDQQEGELLASIDPTLQMQAVTDAQANLDKVQAQLLEAQREFSRNRELAESGLIARSLSVIWVLHSAWRRRSEVRARCTLIARGRLSYTSIYAPIGAWSWSGTSIRDRTVAASLSAPQLFLIANDLSQMQILAQVARATSPRSRKVSRCSHRQALQGRPSREQSSRCVCSRRPRITS